MSVCDDTTLKPALEYFSFGSDLFHVASDTFPSLTIKLDLPKEIFHQQEISSCDRKYSLLTISTCQRIFFNEV